MKTTQKGFTIVELLIVIVVIGILAALVLNAFSGAQAKARDSQRATDIKALASQLEVYYINQVAGASSYPDVNTTPSATTMSQTLTSAMTGLDKNAVIDPLDGTSYSIANATALTTGSTAPSSGTTAPSSSNHKYLYVPYNGTGGSATLCTAQPCAHYTMFYYTENTPAAGVQQKNSIN